MYVHVCVHVLVRPECTMLKFDLFCYWANSSGTLLDSHIYIYMCVCLLIVL